MHDTLHGGQADAGKLLQAVQTLERLEQPVGMAHIETGAVVGDAKAAHAIPFLGVYAYARRRRVSW
jgi:hypothetical protein